MPAPASAVSILIERDAVVLAGPSRTVDEPVIDLHCHVLPAIDDGPATLEASLELIRMAAAAGTETLVATPHVSARYANTADSIATRHEQVAERLAREQVPLELLWG